LQECDGEEFSLTGGCGGRVSRRDNIQYVIVSVYRLSRIFLERSQSWLRLRNARRVGTLSGMRCTDRRITSGLPVIREESARAGTCLPCDSGGRFCRLWLQIRPAEKIGVAWVRTQRIEHGVRFYVSDAYYGVILISFFQPLEGFILLHEARIDFDSPDR
jgi:hypothetical protein